MTSPPSTAATPRPLAPQWRGLRFFNAYRLSAAALLLVVHALSASGNAPFPLAPDSFTLIAAAYGLAALLLLTLDELRIGGYAMRLQIGLAIDIVALGLLGYLEPLPAGNIHILMVVNIAYASLLLGGREALAFAALGSVHLLLLAFWFGRGGSNADMMFTHAGLIGMALFAVAILARTLARRLEASQRLAEQRGVDLANETQLNRLILERTHEGVLIVDEDDAARHTNQAARQLLGCGPDDMTCSRQLGTIHPALLNALRAWRQHPDPSLTLTRIEQPRPLQVRISALTASSAGPVALFIEDDAYLMEQMQQAKLAALGRLSASIAHEIRNPLSAIGHAGQLLEETARDAQDQHLLDIIRSHVGRINRIVENVLVTSRRKLAEPRAIELSDWLGHFVEQYRELHATEDAIIELAQPATLHVQVDPGHLEQILLILLDNARLHGRSTDGRSRIHIGILALGPRERPCIQVCDHGPSIPPETRERLFEPFFTTIAQGNGLGLFIARELAEANRATLHHLPNEQGGSCFRLSFPSQEAMP